MKSFTVFTFTAMVLAGVGPSISQADVLPADLTKTETPKPTSLAVSQTETLDLHPFLATPNRLTWLLTSIVLDEYLAQRTEIENDRFRMTDAAFKLMGEKSLTYETYALTMFMQHWWQDLSLSRETPTRARIQEILSRAELQKNVETQTETISQTVRNILNTRLGYTHPQALSRFFKTESELDWNLRVREILDTAKNDLITNGNMPRAAVKIAAILRGLDLPGIKEVTEDVFDRAKSAQTVKLISEALNPTTFIAGGAILKTSRFVAANIKLIKTSKVAAQAQYSKTFMKAAVGATATGLASGIGADYVVQSTKENSKNLDQAVTKNTPRELTNPTEYSVRINSPELTQKAVKLVQKISASGPRAAYRPEDLYQISDIILAVEAQQVTSAVLGSALDAENRLQELFKIRAEVFHQLDQLFKNKFRLSKSDLHQARMIIYPYFQHYRLDNPILANSLSKDGGLLYGGNCVSRTLLLAAFLAPKLAEHSIGFTMGIQNYSDHMQFVWLDSNNQIYFTMESIVRKSQKNPRIVRIESLLVDYLLLNDGIDIDTLDLSSFVIRPATGNLRPVFLKKDLKPLGENIRQSTERSAARQSYFSAGVFADDLKFSIGAQPNDFISLPPSSDFVFDDQDSEKSKGRATDQNGFQNDEQIEIVINPFENVVLYNYPRCVVKPRDCDRSRIALESRFTRTSQFNPSSRVPKFYQSIRFAIFTQSPTLSIHNEKELMEAIETRFLAIILDPQFKAWKAANFAPEKIPTDKYLSQPSSIIYQIYEIYNMGRVDQYLGCPSESFCKKFVNLAKKHGLDQDSQKFLSRSISTMRSLKTNSFKKIWIRHLEKLDRDGVQRIKTWIQWMTRIGSDPIHFTADEATEEGRKLFSNWLSTNRYQYWETFPMSVDPEPTVGTPIPLSSDEERDLASAINDLKINLPNLYPKFASAPSYTKPKEHKGFIVNFLSKPSPTESDDRRPFLISETLCYNMTFDTGNTIVTSKDCRRNYDERMSEYVAKRYGSISKSETSKTSKSLLDNLTNKSSKILKRSD